MSKNKAKGTAWERRIVDYLIANNFPYAERRALEGMNDRGDVAGVPGVVIEAKNAKAMDLAGWMDEAIKEKANAGVDIGVVCFPRRSHATSRAYVLMELEQFVEMIK